MMKELSDRPAAAPIMVGSSVNVSRPGKSVKWKVES